MNQIKDDLQNIETLKSSIAKKDTELQVKSETINGLQGTIDELRSTIKSLGERERNSTQTSSQLLEKILQSNTTLASKLEKSLQAGNENQKQTQILIQNTKHLTDQNNLLMEKENMILDTVRKPNVFPDGHRNLYPGADHSFKSPRILQPRFTAQIRPSPTALVAPIRREQCVPLDISLTNEIDVKMETSSPRKQGSFCSKKDRTTDMFDISSDSEGEDMGNIVNNFLISSSNTSNENEQLVPCNSTQQKQTYQQHQHPQQPKTQKPQICSQPQSQRPQTQSNINRQNTFNSNKLQQRNVQKSSNNRQQQLQQPACQRKIQQSKNNVNKVDLTFSSSIKTSTPINNNKSIAKKQPMKASTPVQRSIRRYGKIKKSVNPFSPVHKQLSTSVQGKRRQLSYDAADESFLANQTAPPSSNIRTNRGCLAKKRKLENVFNFDSFEGDEDLKQLSKVFQRRKSNGSIKTY